MPRIQYLGRAAFVPLVATASLDVATGAQGGAPPAHTRTLQYQSITAPVLVPPAAETVTVDKWHSQPPGLPRRAWGVTGAQIVAPLYVPDTTQPVVERSWAPTYPDRVPARPRTSELGQSVGPLYVPDVTSPVVALDWANDLPDVARLGRQVVGGVVAPPEQPAAPADVVLDWLSQSPTPTRRLTVVASGGVGPVDIPAPTTPAPDLSWAPALADVVRRPLVVVGGSIAPVAPVADAPPVQASPGVQGGPVPLSTRTVQYQALTGPLLSFVTPPAPAPDLWYPTLPTRAVERDGPTLQYSDLTGPIEIIVETDWIRQFPDPIRAKARGINGGVVAPVDPIPDAPVVVPILSWAPIYPQPTRRVARPTGGIVAPFNLVVSTFQTAWAKGANVLLNRKRRLT